MLAFLDNLKARRWVGDVDCGQLSDGCRHPVQSVAVDCHDQVKDFNLREAVGKEKWFAIL
jgi:hypothetical protein